MFKIIFLYDVVPGEAENAKTWARDSWIPYWTNQEAVKNYKVYTNFFGPPKGIPVASPQRMVSFEVSNLQEFDSILSTKEYKKLAQEIQHYVIDLKLHIFRLSYSDGSPTKRFKS